MWGAGDGFPLRYHIFHSPRLHFLLFHLMSSQKSYKAFPNTAGCVGVCVGGCVYVCFHLSLNDQHSMKHFYFGGITISKTRRRKAEATRGCI